MPMIQSPRTQAMGGINPGMPGDQAKSLFDQGLSQMAYNVLINKLPNVSPDVVTFKVLESDPEEGSGVGAFVVSRHGQTVYIPVVMASNQVKPLDILYYKDMNVFLPLTKEWLEELDKLSLGELGQGTLPPRTLNTDVDLRNMVVPPTTGRYSYAAEDGAGRVFDEARLHVDPKPCFLEFLDRAPNRVKRAAAKLFETHTSLLKTAVWHYGPEALTKALQVTEEKVADYGGKLSRSGGLYVADKKTKTTEFKEIWGEQAGVAYQGVALKGYFAKDERKKHKKAFKTQNELHLTEPKEAGAYRLWKKDGTEIKALIVNGAENFFRDYDLCCGKSWGNESWKKPKTPKRYIGVTSEGRLLDQHDLIAEPIPFGELEGSTVYKKVTADEPNESFKIGQWGIFVRPVGAGGFVATVPCKIKSITTIEKAKHVEITENEYEQAPTVTLVFDGEARNFHSKGTRVFHLSREYRWCPVEGAKYDARYRDRDFITDPRDVLNLTVTGLQKHGAERFLVRKKLAHGFALGDRPTRDYSFTEALQKLAVDAGITVEDAEAALKEAEAKGRFEFWSIPDEGLAKLAAEDGGSKPKAGAPDPAEDAMNQIAAAQMAGPQGPTPVDMAVAEQLQNLQMQQASLQQQMMLLQNVQQRANMIAGGGGAAGAPGAAAAAMGGPMDPSMMGAGAPVGQPMPGGMPPPGGGGMPQGASQPGMQPGMGPSAAGMAQPGQDPNQPPMATMTADDGSSDTLMNQVNPQFMEQAGALQDQGVFDAAALASMAQSPQLKDLVSGYIPNLEKSLDNIGRVLLTLWMDESKIKEDIGDETYIAIEDNLRTVFKGLGELILKINSNTAVLRSGTQPVE